MSWAELFERAAAFDVTEGKIVERLAARRGRDEDGGDPAADDT